MNKIENNQLVENILAEFEKTNSQMTELMRLQNELSHAENELIALQIRYVHKNKENEDLKIQLEKKNKQLNEKTTESECKLERFQSLEFHYNDLMQKHKLCLECMSKQKTDMDAMKAKYDNLINENKKLENDKSQLRELFGDQVNDLEINIKKIIDENDRNVDIIKELRLKYQTLEGELEKSKQFSDELIESKENLRKNLDTLKEQYNKNMGDQCFKNDANEEKINSLQLELARLNSKLDESHLQYNEMKSNYLNQLKTYETLQKAAHKKEVQYDELKISYEKCLYEIQTLNQVSLKQKQDFEAEFNELKNQVDSNCKLFDIENSSLKKHKKLYEGLMKKNVSSYNEQQKMFESLITLFKNQTLIIKTLKSQVSKFSKDFVNYKIKYKSLNSECDESNVQIKNLQEKCFDLESKYSEKCEHLNTLERENYLTRNSLESAMNDLTNLSNVIANKNEEIIMKNQTIDRLESITNQLNAELSKRKGEITERITQIELIDKQVKEEKTILDLKMAHLEANLKSKSKQLNQRIEQIKGMNDIVNNLKDEKEQAEYKLEQYDNLIKCQKLEIESKSSLIKQLELRIQDTKNELEHLKNDSNSKNTNTNKTKTEQNFVLINNSKTYDIKGTQTDEIENLNESSIKELNNELNSNTDTEKIEMNSNSSEDKTCIDELKINLKIKENLIDSINDTLVLREAEIARLKTRIAMMERKEILKDVNNQS